MTDRSPTCKVAVGSVRVILFFNIFRFYILGVTVWIFEVVKFRVVFCDCDCDCDCLVVFIWILKS